MKKERKIFFVVASGEHDTDRHYHDTIKNKRTIKEATQFLSSEKIKELESIFRGQSYIVWGAEPGSNNIRNWGSMEPGDYVMISREGKIILVAEVATKVHNSDLARHFWGVDKDKKTTWEYIYFLINEIKVNIDQSELNRYLGYKFGHKLRGFTPIDQKKADKLLVSYGDLISFLQTIEKGQEPEEIDFEKKEEFEEVIDKKIEKAPSIHDEIQWRLIRLGNKTHLDVWVPKADQNKTYEGERFGDLVIPEFHDVIDVPSYVKNIDIIWKLGNSIKSAFEIEHSTQIYSGILRLSDLRALAPNSNYPLFIVAKRDDKTKVFKQVKRPTFSNDYLHLDKVMKFLSYDTIREFDESLKDIKGFDIDWLVKKAEPVS